MMTTKNTISLNENFKITYSFDIAQSSYTQLRALKKQNDDHDLGDQNENLQNEDMILRRMLEGGGNVQRDKTTKRQMKLVLERISNGVTMSAFEKTSWTHISTEKLVVGTVLNLKGEKIHFVNNVLMLTKESVRVVGVPGNSMDKNDKNSNKQKQADIVNCEQNLKRVEAITPSRLKPLRKKPKLDAELTEKLKSNTINENNNNESEDDEEYDLGSDFDEDDSLEDLGSDFSENEQNEVNPSPQRKEVSNDNKKSDKKSAEPTILEQEIKTSPPPPPSAEVISLSDDESLYNISNSWSSFTSNNNQVSLVQFLSQTQEKTILNCLIVNCRENDMVITDGTATCIIKNPVIKRFQAAFVKKKIQWKPENLFNGVYSFLLKKMSKINVELKEIVDIQIGS